MSKYEKKVISNLGLKNEKFKILRSSMETEKPTMPQTLISALT